MKIDIRMNVPFEFDHISLFDIQEVNSSFAKASLKVMYVGDNRNNSMDSRYKEGGSRLSCLYKEEDIVGIVPKWAIKYQNVLAKIFFWQQNLQKK